MKKREKFLNYERNSLHNTFEINYTNGAKIKSKAVKNLALTDKIGAKFFRSPFVVI